MSLIGGFMPTSDLNNTLDRLEDGLQTFADWIIKSIDEKDSLAGIKHNLNLQTEQMKRILSLIDVSVKGSTRFLKDNPGQRVQDVFVEKANQLLEVINDFFKFVNKAAESVGKKVKSIMEPVKHLFNTLKSAIDSKFGLQKGRTPHQPMYGMSNVAHLHNESSFKQKGFQGNDPKNRGGSPKNRGRG